MNVNEVLQFVDNLVVEKTGRHLDDVQKAIIEGSWQRQSYNDIAEKCHITEGYTGDVASELWKLLSEALGEDIKKSNFRSTFERLNIESCKNSNIYINGNNGFYYLETSVNQVNHKNKNNKKKENSQSKSSDHDLTFAPKIIKFYNRETELKTLSNWIFNQNIPLISVLGLSGIGKSYLVRKFIDLNLDQFEVIIWKNLKLTPSLNQIITEILTTVETSALLKTSEVYQLLNLLKEKRCLIILDHLENIFIPGQFAGQYQAKFQDYQNFFKLITESNHQSNIILISREQCPEMECLDEELSPIKCLELSGLDQIDIFKNVGLKDEGNWLELIRLYEGNPFYLKSISSLIKKNYDGQVADFLIENSNTGILPVNNTTNTGILPVNNTNNTDILPIITTQMQSHFREIFNHLSTIEQEIVLKLCQSNQPISRTELKQDLNLNSVEFNNGLQSLQQRYLVTKIKSNKMMFKLDSVFREYVRNTSL